MAAQPAPLEELAEVTSSYVGSTVPGLQYLVVDAESTLFAYAGGLASIRDRTPMDFDTTMMAYSMTKTVTAIAILQLVEQGRIALDDEMDAYLPETPYRGRGVTIRHLLAHTSGTPNPIPLRWVHRTIDAAAFDEDAALADVLRAYTKLESSPGEKFLYSNIGYWLLGKIIEAVTRQPYVDYVRDNVFGPLGNPEHELDFVIAEPKRHADGYLARYSLMNLAKGFLTDPELWGGYERKWLRFESHHLNGPAFGGIVGTARGFSRLLQDQLRTGSVLLGAEAKRLLETQQLDRNGRPVPMTLGWHVGEIDGVAYLFKEGGGGGFHGEMRLYPSIGLASVVMVNATQFDSTRFLDRLDRSFLNPSGYDRDVRSGGPSASPSEARCRNRA